MVVTAIPVTCDYLIRLVWRDPLTNKDKDKDNIILRSPQRVIVNNKKSKNRPWWKDNAKVCLSNAPLTQFDSAISIDGTGTDTECTL